MKSLQRSSLDALNGYYNYFSQKELIDLLTFILLHSRMSSAESECPIRLISGRLALGFDELINTKSFINLHEKCLKNILISTKLITMSEYSVWLGLKKWFMENKISRMNDLLSSIRIKFLHPFEITEICWDALCQNYVDISDKKSFFDTTIEKRYYLSKVDIYNSIFSFTYSFRYLRMVKIFVEEYDLGLTILLFKFFISEMKQIRLMNRSFFIEQFIDIHYYSIIEILKSNLYSNERCFREEFTLFLTSSKSVGNISSFLSFDHVK